MSISTVKLKYSKIRIKMLHKICSYEQKLNIIGKKKKKIRKKKKKEVEESAAVSVKNH